jgi:hypothetical protein
LAKAQGSIEPPERSRTVRVVPRSGGAGYTFKYAPLSAIIEAFRKPFSQNGVWFSQILLHDTTAGFYKLRTLLFHASGQYIGSEVPIINEGQTNQAFGSALTYMKRYQLSALTGIAADEDDDGNIADGNQILSVEGHQAKSKPVAPSPIRPVEADNGNTNFGVGPGKTAKIDVPFNPEEPDEKKAHDWMTFGKLYVAAARDVNNMDELKVLEAANRMAIKNMETFAPKIFSNMMVALMKVKQDLNGVK